MKNKTRIKLILYTLLVICLLASFTYTPSDAKYYKEEENALLYKAKFNQMGGYYIDDTSSGMGVQDDSTATNIHYKFNFVRSSSMKENEVDTYTLTLPSSNCVSTFFDGTANIDASSISFNTLTGMGNSIIVNLTCPVNDVISNDNINLSINVKQQFTNEREYEYATGLFSVNTDKYLEDKIDKLEDNNIYLIKSNQNDIYNRFVKLLKEYIHNNETSFNEALKDYLVAPNTLDSLLDEYLNSIFPSTNISVNDLEKISGITLNSNLVKYNRLVISEEFKTEFKRYFDVRKDFLQNNIIYLSKLNNSDIYNRFIKYLKEYIHNNEESYNEALKDYLNDTKTIDSLLEEYMTSIFITGIDNITINDLTRIKGITIGSDTSYNELVITDTFKTEFKRYFDLRDYIEGNKIKLSKLNTETIEQRITTLLDSYDSNVNSSEISIFIKDHLEEAKRENPLEYASIEGLSYSDTNTHGVITIDANFSSYVKTYYNNKNMTNNLKNFYFFNANLSSGEINTLFFKYLDAYFYKSDTAEYQAIKTYLESQFDGTINNVIDLAKKINSDYFRYDEGTNAIQITSRLYDVIINGKSYSIQKVYSSSSALKFKVNSLKKALEQDISDVTIIEAIINDSNFLSIIDVTELDAAIDTTTTIVSGTNNIELKITSLAGENSINIKVNITTTASDPIEEEPTPDDIDTSLGEESNVTPDVSLEEVSDTPTEEETKEEQKETTNPTINGDKQTTDEIGIITYPLTSIEDNTLSEEKKYIYIKPEDE